MDGIKELLSVLPPGIPELHCYLLDKFTLIHFETAGNKLNKLTENGWLSFWAMFAIETPEMCAKQLTYLDLFTDTDRSKWFKKTQSKLIEKKQKKLSKTVVKVLLFGGQACGKTVLCDRLLCRVPSRKAIISTSGGNRLNYRNTTYFRHVVNRIGQSNEYYFLKITEVPAIPKLIEQAMDELLHVYDMILIMYDSSYSRSFYELTKIFDRMPKNHELPVQIIKSKSDLPPVKQYNQDKKDELYDIPKWLENNGLSAPVDIWLTSDKSADFPALFDDLFFIASNPYLRRIKKNKNNNNRQFWFKILRRTISVTIVSTVVVYSMYKLYKWYKYPNQSKNNIKHNVYKRQYRRNIY